MSNWFVFNVQTGKESFVCDYFKKIIDNECAIFFPKVESIFKKSNHLRKEIKAMFPGYVFVESEMGSRDFVIFTKSIVASSQYIYKILKKDNPDFMMLNEKEKIKLLKLCDDKYNVGLSFGFKTGDSVTITSGPLYGRESIIKRIDRHKRRAEIELEFLGDVRRLTVGLEIIEKVVK